MALPIETWPKSLSWQALSNRLTPYNKDEGWQYQGQSPPWGALVDRYGEVAVYQAAINVGGNSVETSREVRNVLGGAPEPFLKQPDESYQEQQQDVAEALKDNQSDGDTTDMSLNQWDQNDNGRIDKDETLAVIEEFNAPGSDIARGTVDDIIATHNEQTDPHERSSGASLPGGRIAMVVAALAGLWAVLT